MPMFCFSALNTGVCSTDGCQHRHDVLHCQPCNMFMQPAQWDAHVAGRKHVRRVGALTPHSATPHLDATHSPASSASTAVVATPDPGRGVGSELVNADIAASTNDQHHSSTDFVDWDEDGIDFGIVEIDGDSPVFPTQTITLYIDNRPTWHAGVRLLDLQFVSRRGRTAPFAAKLEGESQYIEHGHPRTVAVTFTPPCEGSFEDTLELIFRVTTGSEEVIFVVSRPMRGVAGQFAAGQPPNAGSNVDEVHATQVQQTSAETSDPTISPPEQPPKRPAYHPPSKYIPFRPPTWSRSTYSNILPNFPLPADLQKTVVSMIEDEEHRKAVKAIAWEMVPKTLAMQTYGAYWRKALWVEETELQHELAHIVIRDVDVEANYPRSKVHFTEDQDDEMGMPDIRLGDYIILDDIMDDTQWEGRIHMYEHYYRTIHVPGISSKIVMHVDLSVFMPGGFSLTRHAACNLRFKLNRMPLRRMHEAVTMSVPCNLSRLLFPTSKHVITARDGLRDGGEVQEIVLYNQDIEKDRKQMQCVVSIVRQPAGNVPFIIYGPPGTGKTVTTVESILQLLRKDATIRVLTCAQTNAAVDLLVARLYDTLSKDELFHLTALSRDPNEIAADLVDAVLARSLLNKDGVFEVPPQSTLMRFRVVVCTCSTAGTLQAAGFPRGHFSHIFIDEAAQATEPEAMVPIRMMVDGRTNIVLSGDKEQLQPVVKGVDRSLSMSYVERLMQITEVYGLDSDIGTSGKTIVQLQTNRRSHPAIIAFSNTYIYEDSLTARADEAMTTSFLRSPVLANANFPIVFEGVKGSVEKAQNYNSLYNETEARVVRFYCQKLLRDEVLHVRPEEIGIITPYKAQVRQIRKSLAQAGGLDDVTVGSTEQFQGQERRVIIVSTVRSTDGSANRKSRSGNRDVVNVGFLDDRHRLNVALTRAQALLIVIGDPTTLSKAGLWRHFLGYVHLHGGCLGRPLEWDPDNEKDRLPVGYVKVPRKHYTKRTGEEFVERNDFESTILRS